MDGKDFSGGADSKESVYNAGDPGSLPGSERSPGIGNGNSLQYSCWRISWTEELCRLQSIGLERVRHNCETFTSQNK